MIIHVCLLQTLSNDHRILIRTMDNKYKLFHHHCHYDFRKCNFTNRVVPIWNSMSNHVVSADTVNTFKNCLDNFRSNQDVLYRLQSSLQGTGNVNDIVRPQRLKLNTASAICHPWHMTVSHDQKMKNCFSL